MNKLEMTQAIMVAKENKQLQWEKIAEVIGMSTVWTTSACLGMNSMPAEKAHALCELLELPAEVKTAGGASTGGGAGAGGMSGPSNNPLRYILRLYIIIS